MVFTVRKALFRSSFSLPEQQSDQGGERRSTQSGPAPYTNIY